MNSNEQMQVEFHNKGKEIFFSVYHNFENNISKLNRKTNEYKFQELKKQYALTLKEELEKIAKAVLLKHKHEKQSREIDQMFHQFINDYLHRFIQKVNAL